MADVLDTTTANKLQTQLRVGALILERTANLAITIPASRNAIFDLAFRGPLSPQDAFDAVDLVAGAKVSLSLVIRDSKLVAYGADQLPDSPMPLPASVGFALGPSLGQDGNPDGSVKVTDIQAPTAIITSVVSPAGAAITVTYADNQAVDVTTIAAANFSAVGPAGTLIPASVATSGSGKSIVATYTLSRTWASADNGTYAVTVSGVADTSGNVMTPATGTFEVSV